MKFVVSQMAFFLTERQMRRSAVTLLKYLAFLAAVVVLYSVLFHFIKLYIERETYTWITGVYWTLVTMSTLGFGDITFTSDIGRVFSLLVLLSGIVLLLIVLPFTFIRSFYAPWLDARLRQQAPRSAPAQTSGHVIICAWDTISPGLVEKLRLHDVPYFVIEPDPTEAARMHADGLSVVTGEVDSRATYEALKVDRARLVFANTTDTVNTNITLTVREAAPHVPIVGIADDPDSVDILELSGCSYVLPLKQRLGEHLASRIDVGRPEAHVIGRFRELQIAEFPIRHTRLEGQTLLETRLREECGVSIVGVWEHGRLLPVSSDHRLTDASVPVIIGTADQIARLDRLVAPAAPSLTPVLIIGGGKVGRAAARALRAKGIAVHLLERNAGLREKIGAAADRVFIGDASDREALMGAGLADAPSVILTTNDDAMNIYLAVYCRRLNPDLRIVSRVTHERNIEAVHRAGADFALTYASLGVEAVFSLLQGREPVILGEGVDLFTIPLPASLAGRSLADTGIGARTGLNVVAIDKDGRLVATPPAATRLEAGDELIVVGSAQQRQTFAELFERR